MKTLLTIATLQFLLYTIYYLVRWGIPPSFSHTYLKTGLLFQWVMFTTGGMIGSLIWMATNDQWWSFLGLFVAFPIMLVGAAPVFFLGGLEASLHYKGAYIAAIASLLIVVLSAIYFNWVLALIIPICIIFAALGYYFNDMKNGTWWWEWAAFGWMFGVLWALTLIN